MNAINDTCDRAIYLSGGKIEYDGNVTEAFEKYNKKK